jgi:hypothetical protein
MVRIFLTLVVSPLPPTFTPRSGDCAGRDDQVPVGLRQIVSAAPAGAIAPGNLYRVALAARERHRSPDYESGGQEFESLRARHENQ